MSCHLSYVTSHMSCHLSYVTCHMSCHLSYVTCQMSCHLSYVTCHMWPVICYMSYVMSLVIGHVTCHMLHVISLVICHITCRIVDITRGWLLVGFESYVQEIGRAGRDGLPAECHVFLEPEVMHMSYMLTVCICVIYSLLVSTIALYLLRVQTWLS